MISAVPMTVWQPLLGVVIGSVMYAVFEHGLDHHVAAIGMLYLCSFLGGMVTAVLSSRRLNDAQRRRCIREQLSILVAALVCSPVVGGLLGWNRPTAPSNRSYMVTRYIGDWLLVGGALAAAMLGSVITMKRSGTSKIP